jgi:hypothetical protein
LNPAGLNKITESNVIPLLFSIWVSPDHISSVHKSPSVLGPALDELLRHQPALKQQGIAACIKMLEDLCALGQADSPKEENLKEEAKDEKPTTEASTQEAKQEGKPEEKKSELVQMIGNISKVNLSVLVTTVLTYCSCYITSSLEECIIHKHL